MDTNERLQHSYLRQGFTCVRTVVLPTTLRSALPAIGQAGTNALPPYIGHPTSSGHPRALPGLKEDPWASQGKC
jgi:hypothetical protein